MSDWKAKRFWDAAHVHDVDGGFEVHLDTRPVRTPNKSALILPTRAMAQAVAEEWDAQEGKINPLSMPVTRSANSAIDKVSTQQPEVAQMLADYGDSDLLCYRAEAPEPLVALQAAAWDPLIDWAATVLNAPLQQRIGIMHKPQSPETLERLAAQVHALDPFELTAMHDLVALSGSLVIGLAVAHGHGDAQTLWPVSRIDEQFQIEQWGEDDEATRQAEIKRLDFLHAERFWHLCHQTAQKSGA